MANKGFSSFWGIFSRFNFNNGGQERSPQTLLAIPPTIAGLLKNKFILKDYQILVTLKKNQLIMGRNTSISLGNYFDNFIRNRISAGRYKNASEVVRAGLRLLEEEENKMIALKEAIQEGIDSGIAQDFEPKVHLKNLKANKSLDGKV